jgi:hypothetical protein
VTLRPESIFAGRRFLSPEDDPNLVTCAVCGEDTFEGEPCIECASGALRQPRSFSGRTAFPVRRAA